MITARPLSWSAEATISAAEAESPLISTAMGWPSVMSLSEASKCWLLSGSRPRVETMSPLAYEQVGHGDPLVQQPSGIVPEVEHDALHPAADVAAGFLELAANAVGGRFVELGNLDIGDVAFALVGHGLRHDMGAPDGYLERLGGSRPLDGQRHLAADGAAQPVDDRLLVQALGRHAVDRRDDVVGAQAGALGRRDALDRDDAHGAGSIVISMPRPPKPSSIACSSAASSRPS